jgi:hypothetical protein
MLSLSTRNLRLEDFDVTVLLAFHDKSRFWVERQHGDKRTSFADMLAAHDSNILVVSILHPGDGLARQESLPQPRSSFNKTALQLCNESLDLVLSEVQRLSARTHRHDANCAAIPPRIQPFRCANRVAHEV